MSPSADSPSAPRPSRRSRPFSEVLAEMFSLRGAMAALGISALLLTVMGLVALSSVGIARASENHPYHFFGQQAVFAAISVAIVLPALYHAVDYRVFRTPSWTLLLALGSLAALCLVFVPGVGTAVKGSHRWIRFPGFQLQPSEFVKIAYVLAVAAWFDSFGIRQTRRFLSCLLPVMVFTGCVGALLIFEPDFGSTALFCVLFLVASWTAGANLFFLVPTGILAIAGFASMVMFNPLRRTRVFAYLHPDLYPDKAYQQLQAADAFRRGGLTGQGLWNSLQEYGHLPEAHTDSIIAIIGEELGLGASLGVVLLFAVILYAGMRIAMAATDRFGRIVAASLTVMLVTQASVNIGVNVSWLPNKGMALPFISYGGTSLVASWIAVAILLNIGRQALREADAPKAEDVPEPSLCRDTLHSI